MEIEHEFVLGEAGWFEPNAADWITRVISFQTYLGCACVNMQNPYSDHPIVHKASIKFFLKPFYRIYKEHVPNDHMLDNITHEYLHVVVKECCPYKSQKADHWAIERMLELHENAANRRFTMAELKKVGFTMERDCSSCISMRLPFIGKF